MRKGAFTRRWFKPVPGFAGYWINGKGRLYSEKSKKFLKTDSQVNLKGYPRAAFRNGHGPEKKFIHRLVAMVFCKNPDPEKKTEVNHLDYDVTNYYYKNLQWTTPQENRDHKMRRRWSSEKVDEKKYIGVLTECPF